MSTLDLFGFAVAAGFALAAITYVRHGAPWKLLAVAAAVYGWWRLRQSRRDNATFHRFVDGRRAGELDRIILGVDGWRTLPPRALAEIVGASPGRVRAAQERLRWLELAARPERGSHHLIRDVGQASAESLRRAKKRDGGEHVPF